MSTLLRLVASVRERLRTLVHRVDEERELAAELRFHIEMESEQNLQRGMSMDEARRRALVAFGGVERYKEEVRDARNLGRLEDAWRALRLATRRLRRSPGFAVVAILTLALGIGLATAVFTVADALLLRPLPVLHQDRLVTLWGERRDGSFDHWPFDLARARDFTARARALERVAFADYYGAIPQAIRDGSQVTRLRRSLVSGNYFDVLGARPLLGRTLRPADDVRGAAPVAVLGHAAWQRRFGGDPGVLGRRLRLHGSDLTYTIVGVMPQGLDFPRGTEFWAPIVPSTPPANEVFVAVDLVGRLAPGVSPAAARDEVSAYLARPEAESFEREMRGVVRTLPRLILGDTRPALVVFAAAAALLLLITCINVANLLLVRGLTRVREIAVRSAIGASRGQVIAQLLVENALLAAAGGVLGLAVAAAAVQGFVAVAPAGLPRLDEIHLNLSALLGAFGITGVAMLLFALAPAVLTSRVELQQVLRSDTRQSVGGRSRLATEALVAGQVALALVVLSAAGLIARSLVALERAELTLEPSHLLIGELALRYDQYDDAAKQRAMLERLLPAVKAMPGVLAASPVAAVPFSGTHGWDGRLAAEGQTPDEMAANPMLNMEVVGPSYFAALDVPVLRGRAFTEADREGAPNVVMLSERAARHYWPGEDPIGRRLTMGASQRVAFTVVGVVPETRYRELREERASIYFPLAQSAFPFAPTTLAVRTSGPPGALVPSLRRVVQESAPGVVLASAAPFDAYLDGPLAQPRLNALLLAVFAGAAVALAAVGLFGSMATMVRQRTRELGVRMALGASARDVRGMVLRRGLAISGLGAVAGLLGALLANRLLESMLYAVTPTDGPTLGAVTALLVIVGALATLVPARSSTRIDPMVALREE